MALLWAKSIDDTLYEIRTAGSSRRLYTNGVFHSQYSPKNLLTGSVWDLLFLPVFFYPKNSVRNILLLGVGGGAVIRQLLHFSQIESITGIELNPTHLYVAKRFFGVTGKKVKLVQADAIDWIKSYKGPKFDLIIDDLFFERNGEPVRAINASVSWYETLLKNLNGNGAIVINFISQSQLQKSAYFSNKKTHDRFTTAFRLICPTTENAVGVFLKADTNSLQLRNNIKSNEFLLKTLKNGKLRYHIKTLD